MLFLNSVGEVCAVMEYFVEELRIGDLRIELSIQEGQGCRCRVVFTARDKDNRRIWRTPVMDENGEIKVYKNQDEAIHDARKKLGTE